MSESNEQVQAEDLVDNIELESDHSREDKFFGVKTEISKEKPEIEVEVVDDIPEEDRRPPKQETKEEPVDDEALDKEISDYSERAGKRISKIKYEYHEERRAKEAAQRESNEAVNRLKTMMAENERLKAIVDQGGEALNKQALNNAQWAKQNAQAQFKKAYDEGDADQMAQAQELLSRATLAEQQASKYAETIQQQIVEQTPQQAQVQQQNFDPDMEAWSKDNPWFMNNSNPRHKTMTAFALSIDAELNYEGIKPESDPKKYYSEVDKRMRVKYPDFFGASNTQQEVQVEQPIQVEETPKRQASNVVAPATRSTGKKPRSIRLTQTQVNIARQLNITPEQYAHELLQQES
tara:strand:+ start:1638 stop:2687 length:1050 start_codon:yes stop_codon:yes gene_type:complete